MAQGYDQGDLIETEEAAASQDVLFYSSGRYGSGYMCGTGAYAEAITKKCFFRLEDTGETVEGHKVYRLKQVATGLYVKDYVLKSPEGDSSDEGGFASGDNSDMTANADDALKVTCTLAVKKEVGEKFDDVFANATEGNGNEQDLSFTAFVLRRAAASSATSQYFGHLGKPFHASYSDTNAWHIYTATKLAGKDCLLSYTTAYFGTGNEDPATTYPAGTTPGTYKAELVEAAHAAWQKAFDALQVEGSFPLTEAQTQDLCNEIEKAMEALSDPSARYSLTAGRYLIHDSRETPLYVTNTTVNDKDAWACAAVTVPEPLDASITNFLWEVEIAGQDSVYLKHLATGLYAQPTSADDHHYALAKDPKAMKLDFTTTDPRGTFWIVPASGQRVCTNNAGWMLNWTDEHDAGNHFAFEAVNVDDATLAQWAAQAKQDALNEKLAEAYETANTLFNSGYAYGKDFSTAGALVSKGWYSNAKSPAEGSYEALLDNDPTSYFHSDYSKTFTPSLEENHYLAAALDKPATGEIGIKVGKRMTGNDFPLQFAVYGAAALDTATVDGVFQDNTEWKHLGNADVYYSDSLGTIAKGVGLATINIEGSYNCLKLAAIKTTFNMSAPNPNRGYFAISELNVWEAADITKTLTPEYAELKQASPEVYANLEKQLAAALKEIEAEKATQAQLEALNAAVEDFNNNLPNPKRVTTALTTAKAFLDNANANNMIGTELAQYDQTAAENLQNVLDKYADFDKVDLASINAACDEINGSLAAFKASVKLPEAGKYYVIRSASTKVVAEADKNSQGYVGAIYNAIVYSANNNASSEVTAYTTPVRFVFANHSSEVTADGETSFDAMKGDLKDSVNIAKDASFVWKAEAAQDGKMVLRNLATGMYLTGANGAMYQSTEPTPLSAEGVAAGIFNFNLGQDANGVTQYMNVKGATSTVVGWQSATDENSKWQIQQLQDGEFATETYAVKGVKQGNYYAATLPVTVNGDEDLVPYTVVGIDVENNKLVLVEADEIEAGVPFVYYVDQVAGKNTTVGTSFFGCDDLTSAEYVFEAKEGFGMAGTITEPVSIDKNAAYLNNSNKVVAGPATIGVNGAYFTGMSEAAEADGDVTIELSKDVASLLTGINAAKVEVLPSVVDVYSINGQVIRKGVKAAQAAKNLPAGVYVIGGKKVLVK